MFKKIACFLLFISIMASVTEKSIAGNFMYKGKDKQIKAFGIQLWSVRDAMAKDPVATLKSLAGYGYKQIESFGGEKGIFWGMSPVEFKKTLDDLGLKMISVHYREDDIQKFEKIVREAASIGVKYLYYPWEGANKTIADYRQLALDLNERGKICKKYGIKYGFHNHDYSFKKIDGIFPQDILMQNTDAENVFYEMDVYWVVTAGENPISWLKKYPNKFISSHIKDREKDAMDSDLNASCVIGTGKINYKAFIKKAKKYGMKYFNVEQEKYAQGSSMECAALNAKFMEGLKFK